MFTESAYHEHTFQSISFTGKEVKKVEFDSCVFKQCDFSGTKFAHCRFTECEFINCNLANTRLTTSTLNDVNFMDCKLLGVMFSECTDSFFSVGFKGSILDFASFANKKMLKTTFNHCSLKDVNFSGSNLSQASFEECNLEGAIFQRTLLVQANFETAYSYSIDPELNDIRKARFSSQGLSGLLAKYDLIIR